MPELHQADEARLVSAPALLRARVFTILGWILLTISLLFLVIDVAWMWRLVGNRVAPLIAVGLVMDAIVGLGLIVAGHRIRRKK